MPEHTSFLSYFLALFPALGENMRALGHTAAGQPVEAHNAEPLASSLFVVLIIVSLALAAKKQIQNHDQSVIPEDKLTLRTFWELFIGYFYDMMKDMMGPKRAKLYFPIIGTLACLIFFSNFLGQIPGFLPPTSNLSITFGCGIVSLVAFSYYGFKATGFGFIKHLFGPWLGVAFIPINLLIFAIELLSTFLIRPLTISIRLMLNIAVDHLLVSISVGMFALFLPIPILVLGTLVCVVQTLVFTLLTSIYITLATEGHDDHDESHEAHGTAEKGAPASAH